MVLMVRRVSIPPVVEREVNSVVVLAGGHDIAFEAVVVCNERRCSSTTLLLVVVVATPRRLDLSNAIADDVADSNRSSFTAVDNK